MTRKYAVAYYLVAYLNRGYVAADFYCTAYPFVTRGVRSKVVTAFCGITLEALYVGLADAACDQLNQNLILLQSRKLYFFNSQVVRTIHKCLLALHAFFLLIICYFLFSGRKIALPPCFLFLSL
jgi:hypothetical protein